MKAVQITQFGGPDVLQVVDLPQPEPGEGQIVVRVESAAVNFADIMRRRDDAYPFPTPLPFVPGGEVAGAVAALGAGVDGPPVGTPVFGAVGGDGSTGYAQYAVAAAPQVIPIPDGLDADEAAGIVIAGTTAMLTLTTEGRLVEGETVLIGGAGGGVGTLAIQIARALGAGTIIGLASSPARQKVALDVGADHVVDSSEPGWGASVRHLTGDAGVDVVLEQGGGRAFAEALSVLAPFGRLVTFGMASGVPAHFDAAAQRRFLHDPSPNQSINVFNLGQYFAHRPKIAIEAMTRLVGMLARGQVTMRIGATLPLADAAEAHRRIEARETTGKVILKPWQ